MKSRRFILRDQKIKENALWEIRNLPDDEEWEVVIKRYVKPRSNKQHGYYRVLLGLVSEHTGYEKPELDAMFKTKGGFWKTVNGVEVLMSTNDMNVIQMSELIEITIRTASQDMDLSLPPPTQVFEE